MIKPLGIKGYGSIPHLLGSRLGEGDHHISPGQAIIATEKARDKHDVIIVQEKLDGSNCSVAKVNGKIYALGRAGYPAETSKYRVHHIFYKWVMNNEILFDTMLEEGERVVGEFIGMAVGTRYELKHDPFVPFDLMLDKYRYPYELFIDRMNMHGMNTARLLHMGSPYSIENAIESIKESGHGAIDPVEGAVWRVERKGEVDFLCKFVHHFKQDGKYFPERNNGIETWNMDISNY